MKTVGCAVHIERECDDDGEFTGKFSVVNVVVLDKGSIGAPRILAAALGWRESDIHVAYGTLFEDGDLDFSEIRTLYDELRRAEEAVTRLKEKLDKATEVKRR